MKQIEFLTREGCIQTNIMKARLDEALRGFESPLSYALLDTIPSTDIRRGYPTPTVLYGGLDLFGMAEPKPPYPGPT